MSEYDEQLTVFEYAHGYAGNLDPRLIAAYNRRYDEQEAELAELKARYSPRAANAALWALGLSVVFGGVAMAIWVMIQ